MKDLWSKDSDIEGIFIWLKIVQIITAIKLKISETVAAVATFKFVPNHNG